MYYEIHGSGAPVVLIHGAASTIQTTFGNVLQFLAKHYKVIAVELQAHGHTDNRDGRQISFEQDADDVAALMRQLHIENASIFGFSNGGTTAIQMAIRHPEVVRKLVIASSMYKRSGVLSEFWKGMEQPEFSNMPDAYKRAFLAINPDVKAVHTMFNQCARRMQAFTDIPDAIIEAIEKPALIITGDQDVPTPEHAVEMYRRLPQARLCIFPGGHGTYIGELTTLASAHNPPVALPVIEDFLNS
jgi:pimeloyl-ACP methyl ester carboxylesterase